MSRPSFSSSEQATRREAARTDPAFTPFVAASNEEVRYAEQLRERLRRRLLNRSSTRGPHWTVGAD